MTVNKSWNFTWWDVDATQWDTDVLERVEDLPEGRPHLSLEAEAEEGVDHKVVGVVDEGCRGQVGEERDV